MFALLLCAPTGLAPRGGLPVRLGGVRTAVSAPKMRLPQGEPASLGAALQRSVTAASLAVLLLASPLVPSAIGPLSVGGGSVHARELASGSGSRVNKDPLSLLRLGLPNQPKAMREVQAALEECQDNLARLNGQVASSALSKAQSAAKSGQAAILKAVPASKASEGQAALSGIVATMAELKTSLSASKQSDALAANERALKQVTVLEELIASGYTQPAPPAELADLPYLKGRATVAMTIVPGEEHEGGQFDIQGMLYKQVDLTMVLDGYTAPVTAGNMVDLVNKGFYNGMHIQRSDGFVVQTGDPSSELEGAKATKLNGYAQGGKVRKVPLEVMVKGDAGPIYGSTFDDDGRGGYASVLPFNAYGALGMAREEYDADSASSQYFWLLFDSDLTPAGKNLLDGRYACFGYTLDGANLLADVKEGDIIASAKVTSGLSNLVVPKSALPEPAETAAAPAE